VADKFSIPITADNQSVGVFAGFSATLTGFFLKKVPRETLKLMARSGQG
jgi:hypothetical protein